MGKLAVRVDSGAYLLAFPIDHLECHSTESQHNFVCCCAGWAFAYEFRSSIPRFVVHQKKISVEPLAILFGRRNIRLQSPAATSTWGRFYIGPPHRNLSPS